MNNTIAHNAQTPDPLLRMNILIFDEGQVETAIVKTIERWGHEVSVVRSDTEALDKIAKVDFDLILVDLNISNSMGLDFIQKIRESAGNVNIVTMTSHSSRDMEQRIREQRIIYYMIKPFRFDELKSIVNHLSRRKDN